MRPVIVATLSIFLCSFAHIARAQSEDSSLVQMVTSFDATNNTVFGDSSRTISRAFIYSLNNYILAHPKSALAYLYVGRAYDRMTRREDSLIISNEEIARYVDSTVFYYKRAAHINPHVRDLLFNFSIAQNISHAYGGLALAYLQTGEMPKAMEVLAFGETMGGFTPAMQAYATHILDECDSNAILFTSGDDDTFPLWYMQWIKHYRPDITLVNTSLINMGWYSALCRAGHPPFIRPVAFDTTGTTSFHNVDNEHDTPTTFKVDPQARKRMSEKLQSNVNDLPIASSIRVQFPIPQSAGHNYYILGGDIAMRNILLANQWKRPVSFTWLGGAMSSLAPYARFEGFNHSIFPLSKLKPNVYWANEDRLYALIIDTARSRMLVQDSTFYVATQTFLSAAIMFIQAVPSYDQVAFLKYLPHVVWPPFDSVSASVYTSLMNVAHTAGDDSLVQAFFRTNRERITTWLASSSPVQRLTYFYIAGLLHEHECGEAKAMMQRYTNYILSHDRSDDDTLHKDLLQLMRESGCKSN